VRGSNAGAYSKPLSISFLQRVERLDENMEQYLRRKYGTQHHYIEGKKEKGRAPS